MIYSRPCEYALRALSYMGAKEGGELSTVQEIAQAEELPAPFLAKVLQQLSKAGVLNSVKGPKGGFGFSNLPGNITLLEVVVAVDGEEMFQRCAVGLAVCSDETPCPLHDSWFPIRQRIEKYLASHTIADLAKAVKRKKELLENNAQFHKVTNR